MCNKLHENMIFKYAVFTKVQIEVLTSQLEFGLRRMSAINVPICLCVINYWRNIKQCPKQCTELIQ